jgi:hypothetical protein
MSASERFGKILAERTLLGSRQDVRGGVKVVAFTESPISMLANVLASAKLLSMRYAPLGFMVDKRWLYERGGRPVIYEANAEYDDLPMSKQHLHVRYEPDRNTDFSWEREWRIRADRLELDPAATTVIVPTRLWEKNYHKQHSGNAQRAAIVTQGLLSIGSPEWHFVALEDLGIPFEGMEAISFDQFRKNFSVRTIDQA